MEKDILVEKRAGRLISKKALYRMWLEESITALEKMEEIEDPEQVKKLVLELFEEKVKTAKIFGLA